MKRYTPEMQYVGSAGLTQSAKWIPFMEEKTDGPYVLHSEAQAEIKVERNERKALKLSALSAGLKEITICSGCGEPYPCKSDCPCGTSKTLVNPLKKQLTETLAWGEGMRLVLEDCERKLRLSPDTAGCVEITKAQLILSLTDPVPSLSSAVAQAKEALGKSQHWFDSDSLEGCDCASGESCRYCSKATAAHSAATSALAALEKAGL